MAYEYQTAYVRMVSDAETGAGADPTHFCLKQDKIINDLAEKGWRLISTAPEAPRQTDLRAGVSMYRDRQDHMRGVYLYFERDKCRDSRTPEQG